MNKTPFFLGDALLLGLASWMIIDHGGLPEGNRLILVVTWVLVGILFSLLPFLADQRASLKREEWSGMANIGAQLQALPDLQRQIQLATSQWQSIQEQGKATVAEADKVAQSMTQESARFLEVMQSIDVDVTNPSFDLPRAFRSELEKHGSIDCIEIYRKNSI